MKPSVQLLSHGESQAVVHLPEQKFLGVVLQGDSLFDIHAEAQEITEMLDIDDPVEARHCAENVINALGLLLERFEQVSLEKGFGLPYTKSENKK